MALFNYASKEITLKIVYYGPGLSGKTTNLQHLHSTSAEKNKSKLLSLATEADRTLFFDFLPIDIGKIKDFSIRFQLYTVPGQIRYNATRKLVLRGADAVVFVADSQREMREQNIESFINMRENLVSNNIAPDDIPVLLQFNKRDLSNILSEAELNSDLNSRNYPYINTEAINGAGVKETFHLITKILLKDISKKHKVAIGPSEEEEKTPVFREFAIPEEVAAVQQTAPEEEIAEEGSMTLLKRLEEEKLYTMLADLAETVISLKDTVGRLSEELKVSKSASMKGISSLAGVLEKEIKESKARQNEILNMLKDMSHFLSRIREKKGLFHFLK